MYFLVVNVVANFLWQFAIIWKYSTCSMKNQLSTNLKVYYDNFNSH